MSDFLVAKVLHVLSSTILFGTGVGIAYFTFVANRSRNPRIAHFVLGKVVLADWIFTATAGVIQPLTGFYLAHLAGYAMLSHWIVWSMALFLLAGACWLPVVWIQIRMRDIAGAAVEAGTALPARYWWLFRAWIALGIPAFTALLVVFYLMVAKPV
jgi:uncharacterized membrane protein